MKIGLLQEGFAICETDVSELVHKAAADKLSLAGAVVEDVSVPMHKDGKVRFSWVWVLESFQCFPRCG